MNQPLGTFAKRFLGAWVLAWIVAPPLPAQDRTPTAPEELMDRMVGQWTLTGTIAKKPTTHDVEIDRVLHRQYVRIHEVSREKNASGEPGYEAWIYIVWDPQPKEYALLWLDNTAATNFSGEGIGHAAPDGDRIPFLFTFKDGTGIRTTFAYDRARDAWSWTIANLDVSGNSSPFADVVLVRKPAPRTDRQR